MQKLVINIIKSAKKSFYHFLLLKKWKNTKSAQLWLSGTHFPWICDSSSKNYTLNGGTIVPFCHRWVNLPTSRRSRKTWGLQASNFPMARLWKILGGNCSARHQALTDQRFLDFEPFWTHPLKRLCQGESLKLRHTWVGCSSCLLNRI